jgi:hypothetical protein
MFLYAHARCFVLQKSGEASARLEETAAELSSTGQAALDAETAAWDTDLQATLTLLAELCSDRTFAPPGGSDEGPEVSFLGVDDAGDRALRLTGNRMADRVHLLLAELSIDESESEDASASTVRFQQAEPKAQQSSLSRGLRPPKPPASLTAASSRPPPLPAGAILVRASLLKDLSDYLARLRAGYDGLAGACGRATAARARLAKELTNVRLLQVRATCRRDFQRGVKLWTGLQ